MLLLTRSEVERLLDLDALIERLAGAFIAFSSGEGSVPPRVAASVPHGGFLAAMPGYVDGALETKLVSVFPSNEALGLPTHQALIALFDPENGSPLALIDGTSITAARTAAASALSTRLLAREDADVLAVLGAGVQGRSHIEVVPRIRRFRELRLASRTFAHAEALAAEVGATPVESFEDAVRGASVVCACTDASAPVLRREWLAPGAHVTSVGASRHGPELDVETVLDAEVLAVESRVAFEPYPAGAHELQGLDGERAAELGEVLAGRRPGRTAAHQLTVYKSMGHALEDAAAARLVYERAVEEGAGTELEL